MLATNNDKVESEMHSHVTS